MKQLFILLLILGISHYSLKAQEISEIESKEVSPFKLVIKGFKKATGEMRIAMFDSKEKYTKDPVYAVVIPVEADSLIWKLEDLPHGEYAIAVYHDKNTNGKLDTNLIGVPKEQYGFSNNARGKFGPAKWTQAKFLFKSESSAFTILVK